MSRHGRKVPTSFYHRFALDARLLADKYSHGRIISVLEGGYSDKALTSGSMAHIIGLTQALDADVDESWWNVDNLTQVCLFSPNPFSWLVFNKIRSLNRRRRSEEADDPHKLTRRHPRGFNGP